MPGRYEGANGPCTARPIRAVAARLTASSTNDTLRSWFAGPSRCWALGPPRAVARLLATRAMATASTAALTPRSSLAASRAWSPTPYRAGATRVRTAKPLAQAVIWAARSRRVDRSRCQNDTLVSGTSPSATEGGGGADSASVLAPERPSHQSRPTSRAGKSAPTATLAPGAQLRAPLSRPIRLAQGVIAAHCQPARSMVISATLSIIVRVSESPSSRSSVTDVAPRRLLRCWGSIQ